MKSDQEPVFVGYHKVKKMGNDLSDYYKERSKKPRELWLSSKPEQVLKNAIGKQVAVIEGSLDGNKTIFTLCGIDKITGYEIRQKKTEMTKNKGGEFWTIDRILHRTNGPAVTLKNGTRVWYIHGRKHRTEGPAVIYPDNFKEWWLNGKELTEEEWKNSNKKLDINPREKFKYLISGINEIKCRVVLNDFSWFNDPDSAKGLLKHQAYFGRGFNQLREDHAEKLLSLARANKL
jgi:hypothetical protein